MPIMKWNTPPTGDMHDRHAHVVGHGDNVALAHAVSGSLVEGGGQTNTLGPNIELATKWSTAPYRGDQPVTDTPAPPPNAYGYRDASRVGKCTANDDTCNGNATIASDRLLCAGHQKSAAKVAE
jgi:hypothetical protein